MTPGTLDPRLVQQRLDTIDVLLDHLDTLQPLPAHALESDLTVRAYVRAVAEFLAARG